MFDELNEISVAVSKVLDKKINKDWILTSNIYIIKLSKSLIYFCWVWFILSFQKVNLYHYHPKNISKNMDHKHAILITRNMSDVPKVIINKSCGETVILHVSKVLCRSKIFNQDLHPLSVWIPVLWQIKIHMAKKWP